MNNPAFKILVAEDDATTQLLIGSILSKWNYEVVYASDGDEAWKILTSTDPPRLLLLDWEMPGIKGIEICRRIRKSPESDSSYIILLTVHDKKEDVVRGLDAGANDYISKPFDNNELRARIHVGHRFIELQASLAQKITELQNAIEHIQTLQGIIPICMHCHKIRDDKDDWKKLEEYVENHSEARFSHGLCPECYEKHYPAFAKQSKLEKQQKQLLQHQPQKAKL
ncbi:response regulator transcription factor [bacterium]|nr:response regulator transcription factor [bacterium]